MGDSTNYDRLVLNPLTAFQLLFSDEEKQRQYLLKFIGILRDSDLTSLLTTEQSAIFPETNIGLGNFLIDENIHLIQGSAGVMSNRYIWVAKMHKQSIENSMFPLETAQGGIKIYEQVTGSSMAGESPSWFGEETE